MGLPEGREKRGEGEREMHTKDRQEQGHQGEGSGGVDSRSVREEDGEK